MGNHAMVGQALLLEVAAAFAVSQDAAPVRVSGVGFRAGRRQAVQFVRFP